MSLVDKIVDKTPEEAIRIINEAYAEKQALDLSILSNPDLKAALVGALLGSGAGGIGGAISAAKNRNKVTINDILKGALLGAVPGATAGYMSKSIFNIDPGSEIASGFGKLKEKAKELKKSLFDKKEPEVPPEPPVDKPIKSNEEMQEKAKKLDEDANKKKFEDKYKNLPPGAPSRGGLLGQGSPNVPSSEGPVPEPTAAPEDSTNPKSKKERMFPPQRDIKAGPGMKTIRPANESKGYGFSR